MLVLESEQPPDEEKLTLRNHYLRIHHLRCLDMCTPWRVSISLKDLLLRIRLGFLYIYLTLLWLDSLTYSI